MTRINLGSRGIIEVNPDDILDINLDEEEIFLDGARLTEARAAQIAREISRRHGMKGGRPSLSVDGTSRLGLRVPNELRTRLRERAQKDGLSESEITREALEKYLVA